VYATTLLSSPSAKADNALTVNQTDLDKLTLVVERECRGIDIQTMRGSNFQYRVNVHSHFTAASEKGASMAKILMKDNSGSSVLVKGPYAPTVDKAIMALEADLVRKLQTISAEPAKAADKQWLLAPLKKAVDEADGNEPGLPNTTWAGVNISVGTK